MIVSEEKEGKKQTLRAGEQLLNIYLPIHHLRAPRLFDN